MARNLQQQEAFDQILMQLAAQHNGIESLLTTIFSFFHRKTDLYVEANRENNNMGFPPGVAEKLVLRAFHHFQKRDINSIKVKAGQGRKANSKDPQLVELEQPNIDVEDLKKQSRAAAKPASKGSGKKKNKPDAKPTSPKVAAKAELSTAMSSASIKSSDQGSTTSKSTAGDRPTIRYNKEGKQIPIGNGGICDSYFWTQSLTETTVYVDVPDGTRGRDVFCEITASTLKLKLKGQEEFLINGELDGKVKTDSMWTIDDRKTVVITLDKCVETWWASVVKGDPEIDTQKVDSTKKVSDYDEETQGAIRKIMFDQNQKRLGLPTSDEMQSNAILERAKYAPGSPFLPPDQRG